MVIEYTGMIVRTQVADLREAQYARRGLGCYMFALDDGRIIDATQRGNVARYINHSCGGGDGNVETNTRTGRMEAKGKGPNCMAKYFTVVRPFRSLPAARPAEAHRGVCLQGGQRKIIMSTLREIEVGEELLYDYKFARELDPKVQRIPCRCGSDHCRGFLN